MFLLLTFFVLFVYIFLFTFMLAYCVYCLSSLKARLLSEQSGGNKSKIQQGSLITELIQSCGKHFSVAECVDHERRMKVFLIEIRLKKLNSTASWAFLLFYSLVTVSLRSSCILIIAGMRLWKRCNIWDLLITRNSNFSKPGKIYGLYKKPTARAIITCICRVPWKHQLTLARYYCDL